VPPAGPGQKIQIQRAAADNQSWEDALKKAGWPAARIPAGLGIVNAESHGDATARNTNTDKYKSVDRGGWQMNSHWHPEVTDKCADDPVCSSRHALRISKGGRDFSQWSTNGAAPITHLAITNGKATDTPLGAIAGAVAGGAATVVDAATALPQAVGKIADVLEKLVEGLFNSATWFRVGKVLIGLFLGAAGVIILIRKAGLTPPALPIPV
jgi:hypothetical protein